MTPPPSPALLSLLERIASGQIDPTSAASEVAQLATGDAVTSATASIDGAEIDLDRADRCGFGEVIFGEGKSVELMQTIVASQQEAEQPSLITRIDPTAAAQLRRHYPDAIYNALAHTLRIGHRADAATRAQSNGKRDDVDPPGVLDPPSQTIHPHVAVVTAGSTDASVAAEAVETLLWMGVRCETFADIGVAGPQRLIAVVPELRQAAAIVVIAGMEGALPAVVGGHVAAPVIAVPTSVGYGTALGGLTPLLGMLTSCAANVAVVNIDAGFKGGYLAGLIASRVQSASSLAQ